MKRLLLGDATRDVDLNAVNMPRRTGEREPIHREIHGSLSLDHELGGGRAGVHRTGRRPDAVPPARRVCEKGGVRSS